MMEIDDKDLVTQRHLAGAFKLLSYKPNNEKMLKMHKSTSKTRLILGGRRSGKTYWGAVECVWAALGIHPYLEYPPPPLRIRISSVDFNSGQQIILPMLKDLLPPQAIRGGSISRGGYSAEHRIVYLTNGTEIDLKSNDQDVEKFEGVARHLCWMDEEPRMDIYQSNYLRTVSAGINGKILITCTPLHGMSWIYDTLYDNVDAKPPYVEWAHVSIFENPHLDTAAVEAIKHDPAMKHDLEAALYGKFIPKSGLIYKDFEDKHVVPIYDRIQDDWLIIVGIDPHDRNPHGVVFCALTKDGAWIIFDEILEQCIISELVVKIKKKLGNRFPPALTIIDTSANAPDSITGKSISGELLRLGLPTQAAYKDWQPGVLKVSGLLNPGEGKKPNLFITENCQNLIREFRHYVWQDWARSKDKYNPKEMPLKKDDHLLDSLRYVTMANIMYRPPGFKYERKMPEKRSVTGYY